MAQCLWAGMALQGWGGDGVLRRCSTFQPSAPHSSVCVDNQTTLATLHAALLPCCPAVLPAGEVEYIGFRFEPRIKVLEEVRPCSLM